MIEGAKIYDDAICYRQEDGRYYCKLYKEPMFVTTPEEKQLTIETPEGTFKLWTDETVSYNTNRKYDLVADVDAIDVYNPFYMGVSADQNSIAIQPSKSKVMYCKVMSGEKRLLRCRCVNPVVVR